MNIENQGIYVSGGSLNSEQIVIGDNASVSKSIVDSTERLYELDQESVAEAIKALVEAIQDNSNNLANTKEILGIVESIAEEVVKDKPNKLTLQAMLDALKKVVDPFTAIVQKLTTLKGAIAALLGAGLL